MPRAKAKAKKKIPRNGQASRQRAFLAAYCATASITKAAAAAKIDRGQHYEWLRGGTTYPEMFEDAQEVAAQTLEDEAVRRAHEGIDEPLVYQGEFTYPERVVLDENGDPSISELTGKPRTERDPDARPLAIRKYSDTLLQFLLKGFRSEKYRDRGAVELTGKDGGAIETKLEVVFVKAKPAG